MQPKPIALAGGLILLFAIFAPVQASEYGTSSLFDLDLSDMPLFAYLIAGCGLTAIILSFMEKYKDLIYPGLVSLAASIYISYSRISNVMELEKLRGESNEAAIAAGFSTSDTAYTLSFGLILFAIGPLLILWAYWIDRKRDEVEVEEY